MGMVRDPPEERPVHHVVVTAGFHHGTSTGWYPGVTVTTCTKTMHPFRARKGRKPELVQPGQPRPTWTRPEWDAMGWTIWHGTQLRDSIAASRFGAKGLRVAE